MIYQKNKLVTLAIWTEMDCRKRNYQDTRKLMRVMHFTYHISPFWLYWVLCLVCFC